MSFLLVSVDWVEGMMLVCRECYQILVFIGIVCNIILSRSWRDDILTLLRPWGSHRRCFLEARVERRVPTSLVFCTYVFVIKTYRRNYQSRSLRAHPNTYCLGSNLWGCVCKHNRGNDVPEHTCFQKLYLLPSSVLAFSVQRTSNSPCRHMRFI